MKKFIGTALIVLISLCLCVSMISCKKKINTVQADDKYLGTHDESLKVGGMSAHELFTQAYDNWLKDDGYLREETLNFSVSSSLGVMGTRTVQMQRKVDGNRIYTHEMTLGDGVISNMTSATKYYFDGENAFELNNTNKKDFDYSGDQFKVNYWGEFRPFDGNVEEKNAFMTKRWTVYDLSLRESLAKEHNDSVYKAGDTYYFTLVVDCSAEAMKKYQPVMLAEYTANMSAPEDTYSMENTVIDVAIKEIDGKMKFVAWYRSETYSGKARNIMNMTCTETCYNKITYSGYSITDLDLLNLA